MANGWTVERRARQSDLIRTWRPWERSTGPRSNGGKSAAAMNAYKHGLRSAAWVDLRQRLDNVLREVVIS
jgi:hypothetical protein